jgi:hypothetical protein
VPLLLQQLLGRQQHCWRLRWQQRQWRLWHVLLPLLLLLLPLLLLPLLGRHGQAHLHRQPTWPWRCQACVAAASQLPCANVLLQLLLLQGHHLSQQLQAQRQQQQAPPVHLPLQQPLLLLLLLPPAVLQALLPVLLPCS